MDHSQDLATNLAPLPRDGNCPSGWAHHTSLQMVESDLAPLNVGLAAVYRRAKNRQEWSMLEAIAVSTI